MIIKIVIFFMLCFFWLVASLFSQIKVDEEANFSRFQNYYLGNQGEIIEEDFILSKTLYEKRNQTLIIKGDNYYLKPNTFLQINIDNFLPGGELHYRDKIYLKDFYIFIKKNSFNLKISSATPPSKKEIQITVDDTPPTSTLFLANFFRKKNLYITNNPQTTFFLTDTGVGIKENSITLNQKKLLATSASPWIFSFRLVAEKNLLRVHSEDLLGNQLKERHQIVMDNQGPQVKLQIKEGDKSMANFTENSYSFIKAVEVSFILQDNYSDKNQLYLSQSIEGEPFTSFALSTSLFLTVTEDKVIYYYAEDQLKNISSIQKIILKKKKVSAISTL